MVGRMLSMDEGSGLAIQPQVEMVRSVARENALTTELTPRWNRGSDLAVGVQNSPIQYLPANSWFSTSTSHAKINERATGTGAASSSSYWEQGIRTEMRELRSTTQAEMAALSMAVVNLTHAVAAMQSAPSQDSWSSSIVVVAPPADLMAGDHLSETLDQLADGALGWSEGWEQVATAALNDGGDSSLRAAAGRALAVHAPTRAAELLSSRIDKEQNRFVKAILRSSLDALSV